MYGNALGQNVALQQDRGLQALEKQAMLARDMAPQPLSTQAVRMYHELVTHAEAVRESSLRALEEAQARIAAATSDVAQLQQQLAAAEAFLNAVKQQDQLGAVVAR